MADKKRRHRRARRPKGSYPHPDGGFVVEPKAVFVPRAGSGKRRRNVVVIPVHRDEPDLERYARVLIDLARAEIAAEIEAKRRLDEKR